MCLLRVKGCLWRQGGELYVMVIRSYTLDFWVAHPSWGEHGGTEAGRETRDGKVLPYYTARAKYWIFHPRIRTALERRGQVLSGWESVDAESLIGKCHVGTD